MSSLASDTVFVPSTTLPHSEPATVRLLLGADRLILRAALRRLLDAEPGFEVVGEAPSITAAIRPTQQLAPDIVLFDVPAPGPDELVALQSMAAISPCRIVLLTRAIERAQIVEALRCGVRGVLTKESTTDLLFKSMRCVMANQYWVGRESLSDLIQYLHQQTPANGSSSKNTFGLTRRERQITATVASGYTNKDIAYQFSLSEDTVKHHVSHIFDKVGVSNRLELALFALHHGLTHDA